MCIVMQMLEDSSMFSKVSESHHSLLVSVGAHAQRCRSPLICIRTKCFIWVDTLSFCHSEPLITNTIFEMNHPQTLWATTTLSNANKPSRWCRSLRVISTNSHLTIPSLIRSIDTYRFLSNTLMRPLIKWISNLKSVMILFSYSI